MCVGLLSCKSILGFRLQVTYGCPLSCIQGLVCKCTEVVKRQIGQVVDKRVVAPLRKIHSAHGLL